MGRSVNKKMHVYWIYNNSFVLIPLQDHETSVLRYFMIRKYVASQLYDFYSQLSDSCVLASLQSFASLLSITWSQMLASTPSTIMALGNITFTFHPIESAFNWFIHSPALPGPPFVAQGHLMIKILGREVVLWSPEKLIDQSSFNGPDIDWKPFRIGNFICTIA